MRVYLDNCCFNRPFDGQSQPPIRLETEAKLEIQRRIRTGSIELAWSYILDFENAANPFTERRESVGHWKSFAIEDVVASANVVARAKDLQQFGLRSKDALHVACAISAGCDFFITTDEDLLRKTKSVSIIRVVNPTQWIVEMQQ